MLADKKHCDNKYERDDLKITLKLFMDSFDFQHLRDAVEAVLKQLDTDVIEQLILAFPQSGGQELNFFVQLKINTRGIQS